VKKIAVLPTLLTLGNGICGFVAITFTSKIVSDGDITNFVLTKVGTDIPAALMTEIRDKIVVDNETNFMWAGWFLLLAMLFDMLDGYVARLSNTQSDFGGELDSLCDVVSFGITPAFLLLKLGPGWDNGPLHMLLAGIAALYFSCAALRLARFNVENDPDAASHKKFRGLPSPGAAGCIAALAIVRGEFAATLASRWGWIQSGVDLEALRGAIYVSVQVLAPIVALGVALLMVSNVPFPHLTGKIFRGKKHLGHLVQVLLAAFIILAFRPLAPLLVFWVYAFIFPLRSVLFKPAADEVPPPVEPAKQPDEQAPSKS
jgi:CDP-diacylglycerol--serine O-phosphatidyltransferase